MAARRKSNRRSGRASRRHEPVDLPKDEELLSEDEDLVDDGDLEDAELPDSPDEDDSDDESDLDEDEDRRRAAPRATFASKLYSGQLSVPFIE